MEPSVDGVAQVANNATTKQWLMAAAAVVVGLLALYYFIELISRAWARGQVIED